MTDIDFPWLDKFAHIRNLQKHDITAGYTQHHIKSQVVFTRNLNIHHGWDGVKILHDIVDNDQIDIWKDMIDEDVPLLQEHHFRVNVLHRILNDVVDEAIAGYFMSEYTPIWMKFLRYDPDEERPPAVGWHCDGGPTKHLKLLLYLSDSKEVDSGTGYLDKFQTQRFKNIGYAFTGLEQRLESLKDLASQFDCKYTPSVPMMFPGSGILFEPTNIMHRAVWPTKKSRYIIQICFLPSEENWKDVVKHTEFPRESNAWVPIDRLNSYGQTVYHKNFKLTKEQVTPAFEWLIKNSDQILQVDQAVQMITEKRLNESKNLDVFEGGDYVQKFVTVRNVDGLKETSPYLRPLRLMAPLKAMDGFRVNSEKKALIIGPRSEAELMGLYAMGFDPKNVDAIDLISYSPHIQIGDMHELPYEDNTYDLIVAGWVLAYSIKNRLVAEEIMRVGKSDVWIAIGCNGEKRAAPECIECVKAEGLSRKAIGGVLCVKPGDDHGQSDKIISRFWNTKQIHRLFKNRIQCIVFDYNRQLDESEFSFVELITIFRLKNE